jgi:hypothetical protein
LGCVLVACFAAFVTYKFVELPIRFGEKRQQAKIYALIAVMTILCCAGAIVYAKDGLPKRSSTALAENVTKNLQLPIRDDAAGRQYAPGFSCRYTDGGSSRTVVVIGDSHATSAYPGIAEENARLGLNTFFIYYKFLLPELKRTEELLAAKEDIRHVFLFYRGVVYLTGNDNDGYVNYKDALLDKFEPFLQKTINTLKDMGKEVFVVSENPVFHRSARDYCAHPLSLSRPEPPKLRKDDVLAHQKKYLELLGRLAGATIIYSLDAFCPQGECPMFSPEGIPLYRDADHLSMEGSRYQAQHLLVPFLAEIAKEGQSAKNSAE